MCRFVLSLADQLTQVLAVRFGVLPDETLQYVVAASDQAIAPAFQVMETFVVLPSGGVQLIEQHQNRVQVLIAHQLADELDMPFARDVRGVLGGIGQGTAQGVGQWQLGQHVGLEGGQAITQLDQRMQLALDLSFAFSLVEGVVVRINHGGSPQINAAMITSRGPLVRSGRRSTPAESRI